MADCCGVPVSHVRLYEAHWLDDDASRLILDSQYGGLLESFLAPMDGEWEGGLGVHPVDWMPGWDAVVDKASVIAIVPRDRAEDVATALQFIAEWDDNGRWRPIDANGVTHVSDLVESDDAGGARERLLRRMGEWKTDQIARLSDENEMMRGALDRVLKGLAEHLFGEGVIGRAYRE